MAEAKNTGEGAGIEGLSILQPSAAEQQYFESGGRSGLPGGEAQEQPADSQAGGEDEGESESRSDEPLEVQLAKAKAALYETRQEKRAAKRRATELEKTVQARLEQINQRLAQFQQMPPQPQPAPQPAPDKEKDFSGWLAHQVETTGRTQAQILQALQGNAQQQAQRQQFTQFLGAYEQATEAFRREAADYDDAFDFVREHRGKQLAALGHDEAEVEQILNGEEEFIARKALTGGANPAERIYALAKAMGWSGKPAARQDATKTLAAVQRGQGAARSLSGAGGSAPPGQLTLDAVASMSAAEFDKLLENPGKLDALMGKRAPKRGSLFN